MTSVCLDSIKAILFISDPRGDQGRGFRLVNLADHCVQLEF